MRDSRQKRIALQVLKGVALWLWTMQGIATLGASELSSFQAGAGGWHLGTLAAGNLDANPDLEIIIPYRDLSGSWYLDAFKHTGQRLPGFPYAAGGEEINVSPTLCDLDGDGREEILFTRGNHIVALRRNGSVLWSRTVDSSTYVPNGGYQTVTGGFYWYPGGDWLDHLPSSAVFSAQVSPPVVTDLTGQGQPEVITAWKILPDPSGSGQDYNPFMLPIYGVGEWGTMGETWSGGIVTFDGATGRQNFVYHTHHLIESGLTVGRMKRTGPLHIAALTDSDSIVCFDKSQPLGLWGKGMLHAQFGKNQRLMSGSYLVPIDIYAADIDGDGLDEILAAGTQLSPLWQPNETILDHDGAILWRRWLPQVSIRNENGWLNSACLIPCNPDHDNHVDVLGFNHSHQLTFRYWNGAELVDHKGWPKTFEPRLPTPPVIGDVDGDGKEEIVVGTYDPALDPVSSSGALLVFALDGTLKRSITVPGGIKHIPLLADVEGKGRLNVLYRSLNGRVSVQDFGSTSTNLLSWSTHRGNMRRDGNQGTSLFPAGTPLISSRTSGYRRASFCWTNAADPDLFKIYRAESASSSFQHIATVTGNIRAFTDFGLKSGVRYFYEIAAVRGTNAVLSAPFAVLSLANSNLIANAGFELNDNCRWDKWFTGNLPMTNMSVTTNVSFEGERSMSILLRNHGANGTIAQYNQYGIPDSTLYTVPGAFYSFGCWMKSGGISPATEHWLEWSSTKTGYETNNRPELPDPFYYTPHFAPGTAASPWTYVNRTFQLPPGFENLEVRHRYTVSGPASGVLYLDNVSLRRLPYPWGTNWTSLIAFGEQWRYQTNTPAAGWTARDFNDDNWPVGTAKFGNGSGPTNLVTRLPQQLSSYFFRKRFTVPSTDIEELLLAMTCTDASVESLFPPRVYINGQELETCIDTVTMQGNQIRYFDLLPFAERLQTGTNVIAVRLGNTWSDYDDVAFDLSLRAITYRPVLPKLELQCVATSAPAIGVETAKGSVWRLQTADSLGQVQWRDLNTFTNTSGGRQTLVDSSSGPASGTEGIRLYRLVPF